MTGRSRYAATSVAIVGLSAAVAWPLLAAPARMSLLAVGGMAALLQFLLFGVLSGAHGDPNRFMKWWAVGMAARVSFVAMVGLVVTLWGGAHANVAVLSAVAFVFALHLIEPVFLDTPNRNEYAR